MFQSSGASVPPGEPCRSGGTGIHSGNMHRFPPAQLSTLLHTQAGDVDRQVAGWDVGLVPVQKRRLSGLRGAHKLASLSPFNAHPHPNPACAHFYGFAPSPPSRTTPPIGRTTLSPVQDAASSPCNCFRTALHAAGSALRFPRQSTAPHEPRRPGRPLPRSSHRSLSPQ
jgi:hypothetical protein